MQMRDDRLNGFTLPEVLVVMVLVTVIAAAVFISFVVSRRAFLSADASIQVQQEARRALDALVTELRKAGNVDTDLTTPGGNTPAGGATRLNVQLAKGYNVSGCTLNAICWGNDTTNGGWVHYLQNGTQLVRCQSNASDTVITNFTGCRVVANGAQTFVVDYVNSTRTVTLHVAVQQTSPQLPGGTLSTGSAPLMTQVRLRN